MTGGEAAPSAPPFTWENLGMFYDRADREFLDQVAEVMVRGVDAGLKAVLRAAALVLLLFSMAQFSGCTSAQPAKPAPAPAPPVADAAAAAPAFKTEEIEQLVAPVALYPDALLAQVLMASTYPLEVVQAARWVKDNPALQGKALEDALQTQPWDASVKSLAAFPQVLTMMNEKLDLTQKLGDAFLAQPKDVMDAVQRLRAKAQAEGNLQTTQEQTVTVEQSGTQSIVIIEPADPQVVYVPTYDPTVVYGTWPYPYYPPYYYYPPGYVAARALVSFGIGMAIGGALWGDCDWGHGDVDIDIDRYNEFNRTNISNKKWEHKPEHRRGVEYRDRASQQKFGQGNRASANTREAYRGRAEGGRQELSRGSADGGQPRPGERPGDRAIDRGGTRRDSGAFHGIDNGAAARRDSERGRASRTSASGWGGPSRSYGGGRGGGFGGGGGFRGGGGRGGGRR